MDLVRFRAQGRVRGERGCVVGSKNFIRLPRVLQAKRGASEGVVQRTRTPLSSCRRRHLPTTPKPTPYTRKTKECRSQGKWWLCGGKTNSRRRKCLGCLHGGGKCISRSPAFLCHLSYHMSISILAGNIICCDSQWMLRRADHQPFFFFYSFFLFSSCVPFFYRGYIALC